MKIINLIQVLIKRIVLVMLISHKEHKIVNKYLRILIKVVISKNDFNNLYIENKIGNGLYTISKKESPGFI